MTLRNILDNLYLLLPYKLSKDIPGDVEIFATGSRPFAKFKRRYRMPEKMRFSFRVPLTYLNLLQTKWIMTLFLPDLKAPLT
jgi:hypothetical protein